MILGNQSGGHAAATATWAFMGSSLVLVATGWVAFAVWRKSDAGRLATCIAIGMTLGAMGDFFNAGLLDFIPLPDPVLGGIAAFGLGHVAYIAGCIGLGRRLNWYTTSPSAASNDESHAPSGGESRTPSLADQHRPADRPRLGAHPAQAAHAASLVRLRPDAGARGEEHADGPDPVRVLGDRRRPRVRRRAGPRPSGAARRRGQLRAADRAPRSRADPGDGERRCPPEGDRDTLGGLRQAPRRAAGGLRCCSSPSRSPADGPSGSSTSCRSAATCGSCTASATPSWSR